MQSTALTPLEYIDSFPEERKEPMNQLRKVILDNLPQGFSEEMGIEVCCLLSIVCCLLSVVCCLLSGYLTLSVNPLL